MRRRNLFKGLAAAVGAVAVTQLPKGEAAKVEEKGVDPAVGKSGYVLQQEMGRLASWQPHFISRDAIIKYVYFNEPLTWTSNSANDFYPAIYTINGTEFLSGKET